VPGKLRCHERRRGAIGCLPVAFFPEAVVGRDGNGVPSVTGTPSDGVFDGDSGAANDCGLTLVVRDPQYISHYFHSLEIIIGLFAFHMQYLRQLRVDRVVFGSQAWNNPRQNDVQRHLIRAVYGDIEILAGNTFLHDLAGCKNVLRIDRESAHTRINKFLEPLLPEARRWTPEFCRRVRSAVQVPARGHPRLASDARCAYINRVPPRTLTEDVKAMLLGSLATRFGTVDEIDFATISWHEQVEYCAQLDVLVGVHGNGLTNLLWLPPHAVVIEIFQKGFHAYDYQMMAEIAGIDYFGLEATENGKIYRDWCRVGAPGGDINRYVDHLPEAVLEQVLDVVEAKLSYGD
jgi:hypothetical protein